MAIEARLLAYFRTKWVFSLAVLIVIAGICTLFYSFFPLQKVNAADVGCHVYSNLRPVPADYGASYNVFSQNQELIIDPLCEMSGGLNLTVHGSNATDLYISKQAYMWNGHAWNPITLVGTPAPGYTADPVTHVADWYDGNAAYHLAPDDKRGLPATIYFAVYFCVKSGSAWKCGCHDTACTTDKWQLQAVFNSIPISGSGGTTVGGTVGGTTGEPRPIIGTNGGPFAGTSGSISDFERLTGRPVRIVNGYMGSASWAAIEGSSSFYTVAKNRLVANPNYRQMVSMALVSADSSRQGSGLAQCANGDFNGHWVQFAQSMKAKGLNKLIMRLGWEFNLGSWPWGTNMDMTKAAQYRECWKQVVGTINTTFPENDFIYEWNVNSGPYEGRMNTAFLDAAYPGPAYVDVIGLDIYDTWYGGAACSNGTDFECRWNARNRVTLQNFNTYAASKGKPVAVSEWGVWDDYPGTGDTRGGEDNPFYIQKMCEWAKNPASNVAYYVYFDELVEQAPRHNHQLIDNPRAAAAFNTYCEGNQGNANDL